jgi:hypothetical protein
MKSLLRTSLAAATLALALSATSLATAEPGAIDIGQLLPSGKGQFVEINLSPAMLKFAARIAAKQEPEAAELIRNLKSIRVNVVGLDDTNRAATIEKIEGVRRKLESDGWAKMVTVRDRNGGDNVNIHVKQRGEDAIDGLVITVIDKKGEAVFVNIVGNIQAEQLAQVAEKFDLEPLRRVHLKIEGKKKAKDA